MRSIGMRRAGARPDVRTGAGTGDLRRRRSPARQRPGLDRRVADRTGDGPPADDEDRLADGHGRQQARPGRDRRDQGRRRRRRRCKIIDRAIQVHGGGGVCGDFPLASMYAHQRTLRLADGPDEVHKRTIARTELRRFDDATASTAAAEHGAAPVSGASRAAPPIVTGASRGIGLACAQALAERGRASSSPPARPGGGRRRRRRGRRARRRLRRPRPRRGGGRGVRWSSRSSASAAPTSSSTTPGPTPPTARSSTRTTAAS